MLLGMHKNDDVADKAVTQTTITITEFEDEWGVEWGQHILSIGYKK